MLHFHSDFELYLFDSFQVSSPKPKVKKTPSTPPGTPPESPTLSYTTAAADTTAHRREEHIHGEDASSGSTSHHSKIKEMFRMKVSGSL